MEKILKRLLTAILAIVTVFTTLPVTQVHTADSVYTHSDGHAGTVDKVTDGGYIYMGVGQDLGQFWAKLAAGNGNLQKISANTGITSGNDCYSLSGAVYGVYSDESCTKSAATLTTDGNTNTVELRAGTYYVKETKAPKGFQLDKTVHTLTVKAGETTTLKVSDMPKVTDTQIELFKLDMDTAKGTPQGSATFKDTSFTITSLNDNPVLVDGKPYQKNEVVKTIQTGIDGIAITAADTLPYGHYRLEETTPPEGYLTDGAVSREFDIVNNGEMVNLTSAEQSIYNQIKRGDIEGVKIGSGTHKRLSDVPFKITSKTTGESHRFVTDKNGQFTTAADWTSHKNNTNAGKSSEDGIWFGTSEPDDSKGALPYDTYEIEEARCDSNKGLTLISAFDVVVSRNKVVIDLGTLTDEYEPELSIHTTAMDKATGEKSIIAGKNVTIVDTVSLDGLKKGAKYQLKGWEMVRSENAELLIDGKPVENDRYPEHGKDIRAA